MLQMLLFLNLTFSSIISSSSAAIIVKFEGTMDSFIL